MFVADVKCSQAAWQTVPNSRTGSTKASVSKAVVEPCGALQALYVSNWILWKSEVDVRGGDEKVVTGHRKESFEGPANQQVA